MRKLIQQLQNEAELTIGQISRICDTPKAVVESWMRGEHTPQFYVEVLSEALEEIMAITAETPQERKSLIFTHSLVVPSSNSS